MSDSANLSKPWDIQASRTLYNIDRWGAKYFDINEEGHVVALPLQNNGCAVDLTDVAEEARLPIVEPRSIFRIFCDSSRLARTSR